MKGLVRGKPQHLKEGLGAGGDLPGGLNRHLVIIPAARGLRQEGRGPKRVIEEQP